MKAEDIIKILKEQEEKDGDEFKNAFGNNCDDDGDEFNAEEIGLGKSEMVHSDREGSSFDTMVTVQHFKDHNIYISLSGYYSSQEGTTWDGDFKQVYPKTKTITVYEPDPLTFYEPIVKLT